MKKYIIGGLDLTKTNAGPKSRKDVDYFLHQLNFHDLEHLNPHDALIYLKKEKMVFYDLPHDIKRMQGKSETMILLQYPIYSEVALQLILKSVKQSGVRFYALVHDLESLRIFRGRPGFGRFEVNFFNQTNGIIVHNRRMEHQLRQMGVRVPIVALGIFDYRTNEPLRHYRQNHQGIAFAGNLGKAKFLRHWDLTQPINLYGPHHHIKYPSNVYYRGTYLPEELPAHLHESFGLVWDGKRLDTCSGMYGNYMRYNDPHKTSLYLSSGVPVIAWNQAAIADFIRQHHVGICVNDLHELDYILPNLSDDEYHAMCENTWELAVKLRCGFYIKQAVKKLM